MDFNKNELQVIKESLLHTENTGVDKYDIATKMFILQLVAKIEKGIKENEISNRAIPNVTSVDLDKWDTGAGEE